MSICLVTSPARATDCNDVIKACDKAIYAKNNELAKANTVIEEQSKLNMSLTKDLKDTKDSLDAWYHNTWLMLGIGVLGGAAGAFYLQRR